MEDISDAAIFFTDQWFAANVAILNVFHAYDIILTNHKNHNTRSTEAHLHRKLMKYCIMRREHPHFRNENALNKRHLYPAVRVECKVKQFEKTLLSCLPLPPPLPFLLLAVLMELDFHLRAAVHRLTHTQLNMHVAFYHRHVWQCRKPEL